jgi:hypothetical protein
MHDLLNIPALLALARDVLVNELMPLLPEERKTDAVLVAEAIALAHSAAKAHDEPIRALLYELQMLYSHALTHPALRAGSTLSRNAGEGAERSEAGEGELDLWRRFACDLRNGAFETSGSRDQAARAILWRLTIARLRQSNPKFLAANGFD